MRRVVSQKTVVPLRWRVGHCKCISHRCAAAHIIHTKHAFTANRKSCASRMAYQCTRMPLSAAIACMHRPYFSRIVCSFNSLHTIERPTRWKLFKCHSKKRKRMRKKHERSRRATNTASDFVQRIQTMRCGTHCHVITPLRRILRKIDAKCKVQHDAFYYYYYFHLSSIEQTNHKYANCLFWSDLPVVYTRVQRFFHRFPMPFTRPALAGASSNRKHRNMRTFCFGMCGSRARMFRNDWQLQRKMN